MKTKILTATAMMTCAFAVLTAPALAHYNIRAGGGQGKCTNCAFFTSNPAEVPNVKCEKTEVRTQEKTAERVEELLLEFKPFSGCKAVVKIGGTESSVKAKVLAKEFKFGLKRGEPTNKEEKPTKRWKGITLRVLGGEVEIEAEVAGIKCLIFVKAAENIAQLSAIEWQNLGENQSEAKVNVQGIKLKTNNSTGCKTAGIPEKSEKARFTGLLKIRGVEHQ